MFIFAPIGHAKYLYQREKKSTQLRQERDRALFNAYNEALNEYIFDSQEEAIDYVRLGPAPRFFINGDFCVIVLSRMLKGEDPGVSGENTLRKFAELLNRYNEAMNENLYPRLSFPSICNILVEQEAPEFYISNRTARSIISQERKRKWEEMSARHRRK